MPLNFQTAKDLLYAFDFHGLFIEAMGWNQPVSHRIEPVTTANADIGGHYGLKATSGSLSSGLP